MTSRLLVVSLLIVSCHSAGDTTRPTPLTDSMIALAHESGDSSKKNEAWIRAELDRLATRARAAVQEKAVTSQRAALIESVFGGGGFVREVDDTNLQFVLLPGVLETRRGSCVGLSSLMLALAERLGWHAQGVMVPGHFFVRVSERGAPHNVELLRRGEELSDAWYAQRWPIPGGAAREYARALTPEEVLGVIEYDIGNERRRQGRLAEAQRAFDRARHHFPDFAEAHASAGAVSQLQGTLDRAQSAYEAARRANPNLPGVDRNIALLAEERDAVTH